MAKELSVNKNTKEIYEFYNTKLINTKELKNKTVLIIELGNIKYIEEVKKFAKKVCIIDCAYNCLFGDVFENINTLEIQIKSFLEENGMPKFDIAIMNPPYGDIHLKILDKLIRNSSADKIINISPIRWLTDSLAEYKEKSDFNVYKNTIFKHIKNIDFVSSKEAQNLFGADIAMDLGIYTIDKNGGWKNTFKNKLIEKIYLKTIENAQTFELNKKDGYRIKVSKCFGKGGHGGDFKGHCFQKLICFYNGKLNGKKWWNFFNRNQFTKETDEIPYSFKFDNKIDAENFIKVNSSIIGRWYYDKLSIDINVYPYFFLWFPSFKTNYSLKTICNFFGITGFISDNKAVPGSDWDIILNDMKEC